MPVYGNVRGCSGMNLLRLVEQLLLYAFRPQAGKVQALQACCGGSIRCSSNLLRRLVVRLVLGAEHACGAQPSLPWPFLLDSSNPQEHQPMVPHTAVTWSFNPLLSIVSAWPT